MTDTNNSELATKADLKELATKADLQDALRRCHERSIRSLYEAVSRHYKEHLKECGKAECIECGDAKLLIPYYQAEMEKELLETFPPPLSPKPGLSA